jgi:hypothetical protein
MCVIPRGKQRARLRDKRFVVVCEQLGYASGAVCALVAFVVGENVTQCRDHGRRRLVHHSRRVDVPRVGVELSTIRIAFRVSFTPLYG